MTAAVKHEGDEREKDARGYIIHMHIHVHTVRMESSQKECKGGEGG
jgi:hypothetical protein